MDSPLASSAGCGGRLPPGHAERHETQGLGSARPLARCSARSRMQRACTKPPWAHGTGTRASFPLRLPTRVIERPIAIRAPIFLGLLQSPFEVLITFYLDSRPPLRPRSVIATVSPTVATGEPLRDSAVVSHMDPGHYCRESERYLARHSCRASYSYPKSVVSPVVCPCCTSYASGQQRLARAARQGH